MQEQVIQQKSCLHCQQTFAITDRDMAFYEKISPTFNGEKCEIPTPTLCPDCRQRRRLSFRNERNLYKRKCDASGKDIISIYKPSQANPSALSGTSLSQGRTNKEQQGYKVYDQKIRRSDARDPMSYGRDFDFSRNFTEQFGELMRDVPKLGIINDEGIGSTNCVFTNDFALGKNCYMCYHMGEAEDCYYSYFCITSKDLIDCNTVMGNSSNCYECFICTNITSCKWLVKSIDCYECVYSVNLKGCNFCFGCSNLENKSYYFENQQYTKEVYFELLKQTNLHTYKNTFFNNINIKKDIHTSYIIGSDNSYGDNIFYSQNCSGYSLYNCQNVKYTDGCDRITDCQDLFSVWKSQLCYDGITPDNGFQVHFSIYSWNCKFSYYVNSCHNCEYIFACDGLRNKSYCIFNKQYSKEEYELLVPKIIAHMMTPTSSGQAGEWGEFFHPSLSPFGYNETVAMEYYPLTCEVGKGLVLSADNTENASIFPTVDFSSFGYHRSTYSPPSPISDKIIDGKDLPVTIAEIDDEILKVAIKCEVTGKLFRIIPQELAFYRKHSIPLPRKHPDQRHKERMELRK